MTNKERLDDDFKSRMADHFFGQVVTWGALPLFS